MTSLRAARAMLGPWPCARPTPYFAAIYAFVNIHHYFMDNAIRRRENPEMSCLRATTGA